MNDAEEFVYRVCRQSFLSLWSYANPQGKDSSKELCDILVVCAPDIIIFSVKDIKLTHSGDISADWERWLKRAVKASCKQIYGAERWIRSASHLIRKNGAPGLPFPKESEHRIHRVAVALGSENKVPIQFGDFGKGFVHVFDKTSFDIILQELDTVSDFVTYLIDKENLYKSEITTLFEGVEDDFLAFYLHKGRGFPTEYNLIVISDALWKGFINTDEYKAKKLADQGSYIWDWLIEILCEDTLHENLEFGPSLTEAEIAVRTMAREDRFSRRVLGKSFREFIGLSSRKYVQSRMVLSLSSVIYVYLAMPHGEDRQFRVAELGNRCFVGRGLNPDCKTVVGIATEQYEPGKDFSLDLVYLHKENWTDEDQTHLESMQKELGYFSKPERKVYEDEYPMSQHQ